jgi:hypothetical protein
MSYGPQSRLESVGKRALVELAMLGERARFALLGRPDPSSAILVAGSGRSGTTWLMSVLSSAGGVQPIFEPLFPVASPEARRLTGFRGHDRRYLSSHYLRPGGEYPQWQRFLGNVLSGKIRSYWTDFERASVFPRRFAIKLIRANLMLGYIHDHLRPSIVYITRHPCAVVSARVRLGWRSAVADILRQDALIEDHLRPHADRIALETDPLGTHAVWWAVENLVAATELATRPHYRLTYEELCLRPVEVARDLARWLEIRLPQRLESIVERPSRLSRRTRRELTVEERLSLWKKELDADGQRRVLSWTRRLGVEEYDEGLLPAGGCPSGAMNS